MIRPPDGFHAPSAPAQPAQKSHRGGAMSARRRSAAEGGGAAGAVAGAGRGGLGGPSVAGAGAAAARWMHGTHVAKRLGISYTQLLRLGGPAGHALYRPTLRGFPGVAGRRRNVLFHVRQVELIEAAMAANKTADDALAEWELSRALVGAPGR